MVKVGVIGLGQMGGYHASVCALSSKVNLIGVADLNEQNLKKVHAPGVIKTTNFLDWIDLVDGVIIAVPTQFHYQVAKECLTHNKHVLLEKPLTKTIAQAQELFALAEKNGCALHVGHVERFNGAVGELKKVITSPYLIECHRMGPFNPRVQNDSVVLDLMIHDLDLLLNIVNSPIASISAMGRKVHSNTCDIATVNLVFENGTNAVIISSRASQIKKRSMSVHQAHEFIHLDFTTQDLSIHRHASTSVQVSKDHLRYKQEATIEHVFVYKDNPLKLEVEYFADSIFKKTNLINPAQDIQALDATLRIEKLLGIL